MSIAMPAPRTRPAAARIQFEGVMPVIHSYASVAAVGSDAIAATVLGERHHARATSGTAHASAAPT